MDKDQEIERLKAALENMSLLLAEAHESGKAARRLAREAMKANGVVGAHVVLRASHEGLRLILCAPPSDNEETLARLLGKALEGGIGLLRVGEAKGHVGVSES